MASAVYEQALRFKASLANQDLTTQVEMARQYAGVTRQLRGEMDALAQTMEQRRLKGLPVTAGYLYRQERYQAFLDQANTELRKYESWAVDKLTREQLDFAKQGHTNALDLLGTVEPEAAAGFNVLPVAAIQNMAGLVSRPGPLRESPLRQLLADAWPQAIQETTSALVTGIGLGYGARKTAALMAKGMGVGLQRSLVIARTETHRAYRTTMMETWRDSGLVVGWQRVATHDKRTCPACLFAEGAFMDIDDEFAEHPQGRCVAIPVTKRSGTHQWKYGPQWFQEQPTDTQIAILGPGRHAAWQAGKFDLLDIPVRVDNATWGPGLKARGLNDLLLGITPSQRNSWTRQVAADPSPLPEIKPPDLLLDDGFPNDLDRLVVEKQLGGSTGALLMRDPATDKLYVKKAGADAGHLLEEIAADRAYQAMGINVPPLHQYDTANGPVKLTEFIPGTTLGDLKRTDKKAYEAALKEVRKGFTADALLGNWDVIGMGGDNVLVDSAGQVWRIDNGGSLRRRAQGQLKTEFTEHVYDLWTMRKPVAGFPSNQSSHDVFGPMKYNSVASQMKDIIKHKQAVLDVLPPDLRAVMGGRFDTIAGLRNTYSTMTKDDWKHEYLDDFQRHQILLRKAGVIAALPKEMKNKGVLAYDENGLEWDHLRTGYGSYGQPKVVSITQRVSDYIAATGGDYGMVEAWAGAQAGDSWNSLPRANKYFYANQRDTDLGKYYWRDDLDANKQHYVAAIGRYGEAKWRETFSAYHAFNYEFMQNVKFKNNNQRSGTVRVIRAESDFVVNKHGMKRGDKAVIERGAVESTSIFEPYSLYGNNITRQTVPHHRVMGIYMNERSPGSNRGTFLGDNENELVVMLEGSEAHWEK